METEKCPHCGAFVKKGNLKGHLERVHLKRAGSVVERQQVVKSVPVFRSHRKRNVAILSLVLLAVVGIALFAFAAQNMNMPGTNPGPASAGSTEQFSYLSQQVSRCLWGASMGNEMGYTNWINGLADDTYIQGACCNGMLVTDYQSQISGLHDVLASNSSLSTVVASDPYNLPSPIVKADIAGEKLSLTHDQQSVFASAASLSKENWCCCQCWSWYQHEGLGKILIVNYGYSAQEVAHVIDLEACCGTAPGSMRMN